MKPPSLRVLVDEIADSDALDGLADAIAPLARRLSEPTQLKNALSGLWMGHRLHPLLTDVPIGTWTSALLLDLVGGRSAHKAADRLITIGILSSLPTAASGMADWNDTYGGPRRVGTVHALANSAALLLQIQSRRARRKGRRLEGKVISLVAMGALGVGGYLGGHLSYVDGVGVVHDPEAPDVPDWADAGAFDDLETERARSAVINGGRVAVVQHEGVHAIAAVCTHAGGPLDEGRCEGGEVICPWHESRFRAADGAVVKGPATEPQPAYETRVENGRVEIRTPRA